MEKKVSHLEKKLEGNKALEHTVREIRAETLDIKNTLEKNDMSIQKVKEEKKKKRSTRKKKINISSSSSSSQEEIDDEDYDEILLALSKHQGSR